MSAQSFPARHKPLDEARAWSPLLATLIGPGSVITEASWTHIGHGLQQGDVLADAVAEWMHAHGAHKARQLIATALDTPRDSRSSSMLADAPALAALLDDVERVPDWVRPELIEAGGRLIDRCHPAPYYVLRNMGLLAGYTWSDLNHPLIMTGALRSGATRRVAHTMQWFSDTVSPGGLLVGGRGYRATLNVRLLHATVRRHLSHHEEWDAGDRGVPINQTDMAATWLAFSVVLLAGIRMLGVYVSAEDAHAVMHLWKYACWLMGIEEQWLTDDEATGRKLLYHILATYRGADASSVALARALAAQTSELPFRGWHAASWRIERLKHLSTASLMLGPLGMRRLGLPMWIPPVYPACVFGWNFIRSLLLRPNTSWRRRVEQRGHADREALVALHFEAS